MMSDCETFPEDLGSCWHYGVKLKTDGARLLRFKKIPAIEQQAPTLRLSERHSRSGIRHHHWQRQESSHHEWFIGSAKLHE